MAGGIAESQRIQNLLRTVMTYSFECARVLVPQLDSGIGEASPVVHSRDNCRNRRASKGFDIGECRLLCPAVQHPFDQPINVLVKVRGLTPNAGNRS